jgi:hypothetical protein
LSLYSRARRVSGVLEKLCLGRKGRRKEQRGKEEGKEEKKR